MIDSINILLDVMFFLINAHSIRKEKDNKEYNEC